MLSYLIGKREIENTFDAICSPYVLNAGSVSWAALRNLDTSAITVLVRTKSSAQRIAKSTLISEQRCNMNRLFGNKSNKPEFRENWINLAQCRIAPTIKSTFVINDGVGISLVTRIEVFQLFFKKINVRFGPLEQCGFGHCVLDTSKVWARDLGRGPENGGPGPGQLGKPYHNQQVHMYAKYAKSEVCTIMHCGIPKYWFWGLHIILHIFFLHIDSSRYILHVICIYMQQYAKRISKIIVHSSN